RHLFEVVDGHGHSILFHFNMLRINSGALVYLAVVSFTAITFHAGKHSPFAVLELWFWAIYVFFSLTATKMQAYTLIAAPAVFVMTAYTYVSTNGRATYSRYKWLYHALAALLLILPVRHTIERNSFFAPRERAPE